MNSRTVLSGQVGSHEVMADLFTVAGGLLVALLVVGVVLYLTIGREMEWDEADDSDNSDRVSEFGTED